MSKARYIAGSRRTEGGLVVDYADVLAQAVANERWRVLREVRERVDSIATSTPSKTHAWSSDDRTARAVKEDALKAIDRLLKEA